jgi:hypothetical protein
VASPSPDAPPVMYQNDRQLSSVSVRARIDDDDDDDCRKGKSKWAC